jgi:penicillin-binding protein 2
VIQAQYAPGSTFKIVVATAALEEGVITPSHTFYCGGKYYLGRPFACWREGGHGRLNIQEALIHSCNIFFYQLGLRVGPERIAKYAKAYGLGDTTGIDLPNEKKGLIPNPRWKLQTLGERWYSGETVNLSIGQGYISVTPIHLLRLISAVATRGRLYRPFLVKQIITPDGEVVRRFNPVLDGLIQLSDSTWELLWNGLEGVVERGTGWRGRVPGVRVAGKTGTAQNPHGEDHGWFICFAPVDAPQVAICVFVENGGHGGVVAAPIAKAILEKMMSDE